MFSKSNTSINICAQCSTLILQCDLLDAGSVALKSRTQVSVLGKFYFFCMFNTEICDSEASCCLSMTPHFAVIHHVISFIFFFFNCCSERVDDVFFFIFLNDLLLPLPGLSVVVRGHKTFKNGFTYRIKIHLRRIYTYTSV